MLKEKNLAIHNSALIHCTLTAMDNIHYHCLRTTSTVELVLKFHNKTHNFLPYVIILFHIIIMDIHTSGLSNYPVMYVHKSRT